MSRFDEIKKIFSDVMGYDPTSYGDVLSVKSFASMDVSNESIEATFKGLKKSRELATKKKVNTPVTKPIIPVTKPVAPVVKPVAPVVKPVAPVVKPVAPVVKPAKKPAKTSRKKSTKPMKKRTKKARK